MSDRAEEYEDEVEAEGPLFSGWRLLAYCDLCRDARSLLQGAECWPVRRMMREWGASSGGVTRWMKRLCQSGYAKSYPGGNGPRNGKVFSLVSLRDERGAFTTGVLCEDFVWPTVEHEVFCRAMGEPNYNHESGIPPVDIRVSEDDWPYSPTPPIDHRGGIVCAYVALIRMAAHRVIVSHGYTVVEYGCLLTSERYVCSLFGWDANEFERFVRKGIDSRVFTVEPAERLPKGAMIFRFHGYEACIVGRLERWERVNCWGAVGHMWGRHSSPRKRARAISAAVRKRVMERAGHKCEWCGSTKKLEVDHIHPVARGGSASESNLQVLCAVCNAHKRDKVYASPPRVSAMAP